ncbi:MAG: hypothetical protein ABW000_05385 [Actinoplanes sp.]
MVASLRGAGESIHTLADVFGEEVAQQVEDDSWIAHAGSKGWAALTKDRRIRHRTVEREAVQVHGVVLLLWRTPISAWRRWRAPSSAPCPASMRFAVLDRAVRSGWCSATAGWK